MNFFFPSLNVMCMAENCTHNMHNILTPRGALVRDSLAWSKYIDEAILLFGDRTEILISTHHWPRWGNEDAIEFLGRQRDLYRWLHDQTMRLANLGYTSQEIAEELTLPDCFSGHSHTREYYGTVSHNSKAIYQRYLGWFDGHPANLNPHPPVAAGQRYVAAMGGSESVMRLATEAMETGDYRWACQLLNHLVFAEPDNEPGRLLQADALEQLGYRAESGPWRSFYLTGAQELRHGPRGRAGAARAMTGAMSVDQIFDALAIRLDASQVNGVKSVLNIELTDLQETHEFSLQNCALLHRTVPSPSPDCTLTLAKSDLGELMTGRLALSHGISENRIAVDGTIDAAKAIFGALVTFDGSFAIASP